MKYGYFDDENKEYVITNPNTPSPWINYLGQDSFFSLISNTLGGYSFYKDAKLRRLTRYRYNNVPNDISGRFFYINDGNEIYNIGYLPTKTKLDEYECRHGLGYSKYKCIKNGVESLLTVFVPLNDNCEIHLLKIKNESNEIKNIDLFGAIEFCLYNTVDDSTNFQRNLNIAEMEVSKNCIYHKTEYRERRNHYAFFYVNNESDSFETDRDSFLGINNGWNEPIQVKNGKCDNNIASGGYPIGCHHYHLSLQPNEEKELIFMLGYVEIDEDKKFEKPGIINKEPALKLQAKYNTPLKVMEAFKSLNAHWNNLLDKFKIETPNENFNRMGNIWNQYQCMITYCMSRSASYYESGVGRGMGFRDSCQDLLGFVHLIPSKARERIIDIASIQFKDGSTYHQYQPLTKTGNADVGGGFNDDPLWLVGATSAYIKETGDFTILDEPVPFNNEKGSEVPLYDHLMISLKHTIDNLGPHNLPLIGRADWNDCLNLNCFSKTPGESFQTTENIEGKVAESVFIAGMFVKYGKEFIEITKHLNRSSDLNLIQENITKIEQAVIKDGWDGDHFLRAYDSYGHKIGSKECEEGQIYIEPQGFCTLARIGKDLDFGKKALADVEKYLVNEYGVELLYPPYTTYHLELGEISSYPPGYKENGSVFCHNNPWITLAYCEERDGEKAYMTYKRNSPSYIEDKSEIHITEPYVYSQTIAGRSAKNYGRARNSWLTGTASWSFVALSQGILGIKPHIDGLEINPCLPKEFDKVNITRIYKGTKFNISIVNKENTIRSITIDGKPSNSNIIPVNGEKEITVHIEM
ncbi:MAG: glycosyl transferase [Bacilli bacterium]|nr:glycosyl transferase [Bacilli bacterium]